MSGYVFDDQEIEWARKKNRALRRALVEIPGARSALLKARAAMKKAAQSCKSFPESDQMDSLADDIERLYEYLCDFEKEWAEDADAIQLGILNHEKGVKA